MNIAPEYAGCIQSALRQHRRALAGQSPEAFAQVYLAAAFDKPFSPMHHDLLTDLAGLAARRGAHLAYAAPRGHAKSTIATFAFPIWAMLYGKERFVVIASATADQAAKLLDHIKRQFETNVLLRGDFPELAGCRRVSPWRKNSILLPNGAMLMCFSAGQNLRGTRHGKHRPTLIITDDLEDKLEVNSEDQRAKLADWFTSTLLKAGTPDTNVVVVGTVFHHDSLLAGLLDAAKSPGWRSRRYRAVLQFSSRADLWETWGAIYRSQKNFNGLRGEEGAAAFLNKNAESMLDVEVLWPEGYSYTQLMEARLREGEAAFWAEFQNEPLDPDRCIFARAKMTFWDDQYSSVDRLLDGVGRDGVFYGACDPSLGGDPLRGDFSAIVLLYKPRRSNVKYVIAATLARRSPTQTIEQILEYARLYRFSNFGVEANNFQALMVEDLKRRSRESGRTLPVLSIQNRSGKQQRIAALETEVSQGLIVFSRQHQLLLEQLRAFPLGKHDDGPDALEMAVYTSNQMVNACKFEVI
jgi:predicted phage terminase large subunit-like protein